MILLNRHLMNRTPIDAGALYQEHCAKCHGGDGRAKTFRGFVTFAQNLTNPHWQALVKDAHLSDAIKKGPGLMPGYDETFSQQEIEALVRFVRSLKVSEENSDQPITGVPHGGEKSVNDSKRAWSIAVENGEFVPRGVFFL